MTDIMNDLTAKAVTQGGDLSSMSAADRVSYYKATCESLGLNPLTRPFDYIKLNGKLVLYAKRDATDQLRKIYNVSITITDRQQLEDVYIVTARAVLPSGRTDESTGVVAITSKKGDQLANALMKAETKAKRRVTLSIVGLGWLDETETETIPSSQILDPITEIDGIPDPDPEQWLPDFEEFKSTVTVDFKTSWSVIASVLKTDCGYSTFKRDQASDMYNCLAKYFSAERNTETDKPETQEEKTEAETTS